MTNKRQKEDAQANAIERVVHGWRQRRIIAFTAIMLVMLLIMPSVTQALSKSEQRLAQFIEIYQLINDYYVKDVDPNKLIDGAINGMVDTLQDPYTSYFSDQEFNQFMNGLEGTFTGIGLYVEVKNKHILVQSPIKGSPAEMAGIKSGDEIVAVDGNSTEGLSIEEVTNKIKGKVGTDVTVTLKRAGESFDARVTRKQIALPILESKMMTDQVGYVRLYTFSTQASDKFKQALEDLQAQGMKGLIIDLRGNPGGLLDAAVSIAGQFIDKGTVVTVKDRQGKEQSYDVDGPDWQLPTAVMVDGGTASAAEIVTAALKDHHLATVIGSTTFGKGVVQNLIKLDNGGVLKLTVEEYFTPNGTSINQKGIHPDIEVKDPEEQLTRTTAWMDEQLLGKQAGSEAALNLPLAPEDRYESDGAHYVALANVNDNWAKGQLQWQKTPETIVWQVEGTSYTYRIDEQKDVLIKGGHAFVSIDELQRLFPRYGFSISQDHLQISLKMPIQ